MYSHSPELLVLASSTLALAAMLVLGVSKGLLSRTPMRQCPSCGRYFRAAHRCSI